MSLERIQRIISERGITSRRKAEELILKGRVTVNGSVVTRLGSRADPDRDDIEVDGISITRKGPRLYVLLNKPRGYISAVSDPRGRPVVTNIVKKKISERLFPIGRLDFDSEGVLILTNDGGLASKLLHPGYAVPKRYYAKVKGVPDEADLKRLKMGVHLEDGRTMPARARLFRKTKKNSWIDITVVEGRNRLIKRMCMAIKHPLIKLRRVEFAGIKLGTLKPGSYRMLTKRELDILRAVESAS